MHGRREHSKRVIERTAVRAPTDVSNIVYSFILALIINAHFRSGDGMRLSIAATHERPMQRHNVVHRAHPLVQKGSPATHFWSMVSANAGL